MRAYRSREGQAELFDLAPPIAKPRRVAQPLRLAFDDVDGALSDLAKTLDEAIEDLRQALSYVEDDDARSAIDAAVDELDTEVTAAVRNALRDVLAARNE